MGAPDGKVAGMHAAAEAESRSALRDSSAHADRDEGWVGRVIDGRYRIVEKLGEGGMGAVYVAEHLALEKRVALKVVHPEFASDGDVVERFAREAVAGARLEHPGIASALDYGTLEEGGAYLVMQLVRGRSLREVLDARGALPWQEACGIGAQLADALAAAHAASIAHRDLKPDNIVLEPNPQGGETVRVLDFGLARFLEPPQTQEAPERALRPLTRLGMVMGTPGYMAPEQTLGEPSDHLVDLYALGVILWEMIVGERLFDGAEFTHIASKQLTTTPPRLSAFHADLPVELDALVAGLLERSSQNRFSDAARARDTLRELASAPQKPAKKPYFYRFPGALKKRIHLGWTSLSTREGRALPLRWAASAVAGALSLGIAFCSATRETSPPARGTRTTIGAHRVVVGAPRETVPALKRAEPVADVPDRPVGLRAPPPAGLQKHIDGMLSGEERRERRGHAEWLLAHRPESDVPAYARAVAEFEESMSCKDRKDALKKMAALRDVRALPAVERVYRRPRRGCGFLDLKDCYACLRRDLAETRDRLRATDRVAQ